MIPTMSSFETFYARCRPHVAASLVAAAGDRDVALDATDEAFARALLDWDRVQTMASPQAWVYRVALNVLRRRARRRSLERTLLRRSAASNHPLPPAAGEVWLLVRDLPERQRLAVVLRYLGDLTEAQIAEVMGIKRGTVSRTLADAHRALAAELHEDEPILEDR